MAARSKRWRVVPLLSAIAVYAAAALTFGLGFLLFPAGVALNVVAFRRTAPPRGLIFWLGSLANAVVTAAGLFVSVLLVVLLVSGELS
jgi:hypothetical protein